MKASELIRKLQKEMSKYGDLDVMVATADDSGPPVDIATFASTSGLAGGTYRRIWISTEEAK